MAVVLSEQHACRLGAPAACRSQVDRTGSEYMYVWLGGPFLCSYSLVTGMKMQEILLPRARGFFTPHHTQSSLLIEERGAACLRDAHTLKRTCLLHVHAGQCDTVTETEENPPVASFNIAGPAPRLHPSRAGVYATARCEPPNHLTSW